MNNLINDIFEGFKNIKAVVVGDVMVDAYVWGDVKRISPEAPVPIINTTGKEYRLGGAANVALNLHALGVKPVLCAVIGADPEGSRFIERLQLRKIGNEGIIKSNSRPTTMKTRVLSGYQHIVRIDSETDKLLTTNEEDLLLEKVFDNLVDADVIIFEDYDKGTLTKRIISKIIQRANENKIPTIADPKLRNFHNYQGVTIFKPNFPEMVEGLKLDEPPQTIAEIIQTVRILKETVEAREIYLTMAEQGLIIKSDEEELHIPAHVRTISDVSGAGDTVISIIAACKAMGLSSQLSGNLANIGGGLVCEHVGVVPVNRAKLMNEAIQNNLETLV